MTVAVIIPAAVAADRWRAQALAHVRRWYETEFPRWPVFLGECPGEWSKGAALADGIAKACAAGSAPTTFVLADADSFLERSWPLRDSVRLVDSGEKPWCVPHRMVYRLNQRETERLEQQGGSPRLGALARNTYEGPEGGGITVVSADAWSTVRGVDRRFLGWGGEDLAFGWALETLVGEAHRFAGKLVHLWHPHPAPNLRGSPASEDLVALYRSARGYPRRMTEVVAGREWIDAPPLTDPVLFRMTANRSAYRLPDGTVIRFDRGTYSTTNADIADALRRVPIIREERPK